MPFSFFLAGDLAASSAPAASTIISQNLTAHVSEASQRFGIPEPWIRAVLSVESNGNVRAVSPKGAMGLMQIMPQTWQGLRSRYGFGSDPFDPHDNILAGTAYLREMYDRYGAPGFLAAYNAGPGRYEAHMKTARKLPNETVSYVKALTQKINQTDAPLTSGATYKVKLSWINAPLFAATVMPGSDSSIDHGKSHDDLFIPSSKPSVAP
ncbi:lytic transglycosylase domain-containing protein [Asticcacaulis endophyticus]|uniref:Transglycosylase SLT domain-containing protein n=1 Tax=Asticcacaulis endophyticus TaxID=1395890 RepID=A0A918Q438_9CAUL|nr:lytic transglycosylase domain-containing protein [Asticcacaulis endophyticus]GGZ32569.1 hypothetical protein GCM10011273_18420 [Asticcacaulis endophyticus]